jgi:hypothetical protein
MTTTKKITPYLRRPTKVEVLNQVYKVEWVDSCEDHGNVDLNKCVIQMAKGYPRRTTADTFLHELLHAINHLMGITDSSSEEEATTRQATALCTVWTHNPEVFAWLHKQLS